MKHKQLIVFGSAICCLSFPAIANSFQGATALLLGLPLMGLAVVVFGVLAAIPPETKSQYKIATIVFSIFFLIALLLSGDAIHLYSGGDQQFFYWYFGLFFLATFCFIVMSFRYRSYQASFRKLSNHQ
jgi:uncharacterized membrane protein